MISIQIELREDVPDSFEAKRSFVSAVETANQEHAIIDKFEDNLHFLAGEFNAGRLKIGALKSALEFCVNEGKRIHGKQTALQSA